MPQLSNIDIKLDLDCLSYDPNLNYRHLVDNTLNRTAKRRLKAFCIRSLHQINDLDVDNFGVAYLDFHRVKIREQGISM